MMLGWKNFLFWVYRQEAKFFLQGGVFLNNEIQLVCSADTAVQSFLL